MNVYDNVLDMIGSTPMLKVNQLDTGVCNLYLKLEQLNPGASIKDRIGRSMIDEAERRGELAPGDTIVEATAGNTGLGLALVASQRGYHLVLVVPDKMSMEKINNLRAMGVEVVLTRSDVAQGHPEYYQDLGAKIAADRNAYFIDQFNNPDNALAHQRTTGPEILQQLGNQVDAVVVGVGSSGTITGLTACFREHAPQVEMVLADPAGSILADYVNRGEFDEAGSWLVEGIGEDFIPGLCDLSAVKKAYTVTDAESFETARELLNVEGIMGGSSTGTLLRAALRYCREQSAPKNVVTFVCDTGNRYLSKLYNDFWMLDQGFSNRPSTGDLRDLVSRPHKDRATVIVGPQDGLTTAHNRLRNSGFSQLPVMRDNQLIGIVGEDDIIRYAFGQPDKLNDPVEAAMHTNFLRVEYNTSLTNLVALLDVQPYAAILQEDAFLGLATRSDVLNHLRRQL